MDCDRLNRQIEFILEIDQLKQVLRQSLLTGDRRRENDAEHSWHLCLMAVVLAEYAADEIDLFSTLKMLVIHDLVEIDAGDTFAYDTEAHADKEEREQEAAERIFNLLPSDQARELRNLWDEFERQQTPEARYAAALDRLQPMLLNFHTRGEVWRRHGIGRSQVHDYNRHMENGAPALWSYTRDMIERSVKEGILAKD